MTRMVVRPQLEMYYAIRRFGLCGYRNKMSKSKSTQDEPTFWLKHQIKLNQIAWYQRLLGSSNMSPFPHSDWFDGVWDFDEVIPGFADRFYDRVIVFDDPIPEPISPYILPDALDWIEYWRPWRPQNWLILFGMTSFLVACQAARSVMRTACALFGDIRLHCFCIDPWRCGSRARPRGLQIALYRLEFS